MGPATAGRLFTVPASEIARKQERDGSDAVCSRARGAQGSNS